MLPLQILWLNIATDALPALALGQSPADPGIMKEKPHSKSENIFRKFYGFIFTALFFQIAIGLALYFYGLNEDKLVGIDSWNFDLPSHARTIIFTQMVVFEIFFAFVCKEEKRVTLKSLFYNKIEKTNLKIQSLGSQIVSKEGSISNNSKAIITGLKTIDEFDSKSLIESIFSENDFSNILY